MKICLDITAGKMGKQQLIIVGFYRIFLLVLLTDKISFEELMFDNLKLKRIYEQNRENHCDSVESTKFNQQGFLFFFSFLQQQ